MKPGQRSAGSRPPDTLRCAIYTRKSTSVGLDQEFNSLDAQHEACVSYLQRQPGWTLSEERYDDGGFTGANIDRPAFQRLLADIDAGRIDVVLVYKVDRLSRSLLDFVNVLERFHTGGAAFVSVTQNFSTADAMGRLTLNMLMSFAEFEREMIGERTRDKIAASRRKGKWTGGPVPLGYTVEAKKLLVCEPEAAVVREVFALYNEHRAALAVVRMLNERGHVTKRAVTSSGGRRAARPWTKNDVLRVLKNPIYAGYMASGRELYDAEHTPLVDRVVFARTQALLTSATQAKIAAVRNPTYVLRGLLRCACCDATFTPASTSTGGKTHRYYRSVKRDQEGRAACRSRPLPAEAIEAYVLERLRDATRDGALAADLTVAVRARVHTRQQDLAAERQRLPSQIETLSTEIRRLVDVLASTPGPARRHVEARLQDLGDQLTRAETRLAAIGRELAELEAVVVEASWVASCLEEFHPIWDVLTPENRGRLLRAVVERVVVDEAANQLHVFLADLSAGVAGPTPAQEGAAA
jgi:site-specific DNA recombinase